VNDSGPDSDAGKGGTGGGGGSGGAGRDGGEGGESGAGGSPAECKADTECADDLPRCNASGTCGRCTDNAACEGRDEKTNCDATPGSPRRGQCVQCTSDAHCSDEDADECVGGKCVECSDHADCPASRPQCSEAGACEACDSNEACAARPGKTYCEATAGKCVECLEHDDCDNPEPQCTDNACAQCTDEAACADRAGTGHCNTREDLATSGECVQCTGATEDEECEAKSCDQALGMCTATDQDSLDPCEECAADSECGGSEAGTVKCVTHMLGDSVNLGSFCFYAFAADTMCSNTVPGLKPYSVPNTGLSIDEHAATFCQPITSCKAIEDASTGVDCDTNNALCGAEGVTDGICIQSGPANGKCSYACLESYECLNGVGDDVLDVCSGPAGAKTCQPE
jgi:hypothetical protein